MSADPTSHSPELAARIAAVEAAALDDQGMTKSDWSALLAIAVAVPAALLWLGWSV